MINALGNFSNIFNTTVQNSGSGDSSTVNIFNNYNSSNEISDSNASENSSSAEGSDTEQMLQDLLTSFIELLTNLLNQMSSGSDSTSSDGTSAQSANGASSGGTSAQSAGGTSGSNGTNGVSDVGSTNNVGNTSNTDNNTSATNSNVDKDTFAQEFDEACGNHKGSVLNGKGSEIYDIAEKNGVDPALFAAIICNETGYGTSNAIQNKNNPGGIMKSSGGLKSYDSLDEGLNSMAKLLKKNYIDKGLTNISSISHKYCPGGDNSSWQNVVGQLYNKFSS